MQMRRPSSVSYRTLGDGVKIPGGEVPQKIVTLQTEISHS